MRHRDYHHFKNMEHHPRMGIGLFNRIEPYGKDNHIAILHSGDKLPVSRSGYKHLKEELNF